MSHTFTPGQRVRLNAPCWKKKSGTILRNISGEDLADYSTKFNWLVAVDGCDLDYPFLESELEPE